MQQRVVAVLMLALTGSVPAADLPYVNFENHPIHALDLSPDRSLLAVAHTADQRVQLFDVTGDSPLSLGHVLVGVDPVSVRFRSNGELWVVNHISDSVSVIDIASRSVRATLATRDEPFDVVFAGGRAFVSCSQANQVLVFQTADLTAAPQQIAIQGEDPRALAVSPDGRSVYAAIFESGNATTILAGGLVGINAGIPNVVNDARGPYAGRNPPPNAGTQFDPPINPAATPPAVGLIVRRNTEQRWRDDNSGDWTDFVSGPLAAASGRRVGWNLLDHDIAVIDSSTLAVRYINGLMNIGMALAVNPQTAELSLVGTEALNEIRFEPKVKSQFVRVKLARVGAAPGAAASVVDLNTHLDYRQTSVAQASRDLSIGDPRALVWSSDGQRGWVAGLGSNNVIPIDASGARRAPPIAVGQGPMALALDDPRGRLYVWNGFDASLSVVDAGSNAERERIALFNPLPAAIRAGRPLLYDTHRTSGLGQVACASCHVDGRTDRLAWDLGDPSAPPQRFDQNCVTTVGSQPCRDYHAMKGPMTTQTMQDIIGHEPFHWRGDRTGIEAFNPAFEGLLGDDTQLTATEMQNFENFLATITFPPNPFRNFDNSLPRQLELAGHYTSGRFAMAGLPLGTGDAVRGLQRYTQGLLDAPLHCANCHTLPTGMAVNGPLLLSVLGFPIGGSVMPMGPMGENHLGIVSTDGSTNVSIKVPHLRNQYEKVGFEMSQTDNLAGFGFLHDGSVDSLSKFVSARTFSVQNDQDVADQVALMLAFSGSDFGDVNPLLGAQAPQSKDAHAAVGAQLTFSGGALPTRLGEMLTLARAGKVDLIATAGTLGYAFDAAADRMLPADASTPLAPATLQANASAQRPQTWTLVPRGLGTRLGIDRDGDGVPNALEIQQGSHPADAASSTLRASAGLWYNPQRSGHGLDLQHAGDTLFVTWYSYQDDGTPTWYQAAAPRANPWVATLNRYRWNASTGAAVGESVGELRLQFASAAQATMNWRLGSRSGSETILALLPGSAPANPDRTGTWYPASEPGWGLSVHASGDLRVAVMYFYDGNGEPRWVLGSGSNQTTETLPMLSYRGFCPDCPAVVTTSSAGGQLNFVFSGARAATLSTDVYSASQPQAHWQRGPLPIIPLSAPALRPELY